LNGGQKQLFKAASLQANTPNGVFLPGPQSSFSKFFKQLDEDSMMEIRRDFQVFKPYEDI